MLHIDKFNETSEVHMLQGHNILEKSLPYDFDNWKLIEESKFSIKIESNLIFCRGNKTMLSALSDTVIFKHNVYFFKMKYKFCEP